MKWKIFTLFINLFCYSLLAQSDTLKLADDEIQTLVDKLSVKLLLNESQKSDITKILSQYSSSLVTLRSQNGLSNDSLDKLIAETDAKIISLFDNKQKMKYEILKDEWFEAIKKEQND